MIVNPWSVSALTVDLFSAVLAAGTLACGLGTLPKTFRVDPLSGENQIRHENRIYLVFWMGVVLLLLRFLAWPLFYLTLHSFVPEVEGGMCIFGTRNLLPNLTRAVELLKPLLFLAALIWLTLFRLERLAGPVEARIGQQRILLLLVVCALVAGGESGGSVLLWLQSSAELAVSCCTTVTDIPDRFTVWLPESVLGPGFTPWIWAAWTASSLLTVGLAWYCYKESAATGQGSASALVSLFLFGVLNGCVTILAFIEVIAPRLMDLPFHHCLYCMVQKVADGSLLLGLFTVGNLAALACLPVYLIAGKWADEDALGLSLRFLLIVAMLGLVGSGLMVAVHLAAG